MRPAATALLLLLAAACRGPAGETSNTAAPLPLTGRVVDRAQVLDPAAEQRLDALSKGLERRTGHQLVVVTVPTLGGDTVDHYGRSLFNRWGIGRKCCNDGVGLLIAPTERAARIEVGKGLTATLSDARAKTIMDDVMLPQFKRGRFQDGIEHGAAAVAEVIS